MAGKIDLLAVLLVATVVLSATGLLTVAAGGASGLSPTFYQKTCPNAASIVEKAVKSFIKSNPSLSAALLRLHFHDCFVNGCDGSVMIISPTGTGERDAVPNANSLRGFEVILAAKAQLQIECPNTVSCADTIALAALYAVIEAGGPSWVLPLGRRDGNVSNITAANNEIPSPFADGTAKFAAKGLNASQMAILKGAHTIGSGRCNLFANRLYNFTGKGDADPSLDPSYAAYLRTKCSPTDNVTRVAMKPNFDGSNYNNATFDRFYFPNLQAHRGLFTSDALLLNATVTNATVNRDATTGPPSNPNSNFFSDFPSAIVAMGNIGVLTGTNGAIHANCTNANG